jgi:hypothetical protein
MISRDTTSSLVFDFVEGGDFVALCSSSLRMSSELIPIRKHLARRQDVQLCRVCIFTSQDPLKIHGRTAY